MKHISLSLSLWAILCMTSCDTSSSNQEVKMDTLKTESGLMYYYLTKGSGRKVERGSMVKAVLSLQVEDSTIWTSFDAPDSTFDYVYGMGGVIAGYEEMIGLLREGDNVVAILPYTIAYGERGSGEVIPPKATLVYDMFKIKTVDEPKLSMKDTLLSAFDTGGMDSLKVKYQSLRSNSKLDLYHNDDNAYISVFSTFFRDSLYETSLNFSEWAVAEPGIQTLEWGAVLSMEKLNDVPGALDLLNEMIAKDPGSESMENWTAKKAELEGLLNQ